VLDDDGNTSHYFTMYLLPVSVDGKIEFYLPNTIHHDPAMLRGDAFYLNEVDNRLESSKS
jgi:hypothetical protein